MSGWPNLDLGAIEAATAEEKRVLMGLAIGRLFRIGSRPSQPGDVAEWHTIRAIVLACRGNPPPEHPEPAASILMRHQAKFGDSG